MTSLPPIPLGPSAPTRSKSMGQPRENNNSRSRSAKSKQARANGPSTSPPYRDVIDKLDLSGLLGGGFHHSGPFDAANAAQKNAASNAPIAAFSKFALDPAYSGNPPSQSSDSQSAPLRESPYQRQPRVGNSGGDGISARAKATLAAMGAESPNPSNDANSSAENLLASRPDHARSDSDNSITLGYPSQETNNKERQMLEAFGVHSEAYLDYGNSRYARQVPRASVAPSPNSSMISFNSNSTSPTARQQGGSVNKMTRADRTASIWDIEATLREGRPVGASPPPPMPIIPDRYLAVPPPPAQTPSNGNTEPGVKRSKSLLSRMRSKKGAMISSPSQHASSSSHAYEQNEYFNNAPGAVPLSYNGSQGQGESEQSYYIVDEKDLEDKDIQAPYGNSAAVAAGSSPDYHRYDSRGARPNDRPTAAPRRTSSPLVERKMEGNYLKPTTSSPSVPAGNGYDQSGDGRDVSPSAPRRSPQPPSPLGLPEAPDDVFGNAVSMDGNNSRSTGRSYGLGMKSSMSRSNKNADLASESALAAVLAESSSKESGMSHSTSGSSNASYNGHQQPYQQAGGDTSGYSYDQTDSSFATATPDRSRLADSTNSNPTPTSNESSFFSKTNSNSNSSSNGNSPAEGKLLRKTSLASRLLRGRGKRNS